MFYSHFCNNYDFMVLDVTNAAALDGVEVQNGAAAYADAVESA